MCAQLAVDCGAPHAKEDAHLGQLVQVFEIRGFGGIGVAYIPACPSCSQGISEGAQRS
jgi:hypothetical protein